MHQLGLKDAVPSISAVAADMVQMLIDRGAKKCYCMMSFMDGSTQNISSTDLQNIGTCEAAILGLGIGLACGTQERERGLDGSSRHETSRHSK